MLRWPLAFYSSKRCKYQMLEWSTSSGKARDVGLHVKGLNSLCGMKGAERNSVYVMWGSDWISGNQYLERGISKVVSAKPHILKLTLPLMYSTWVITYLMESTRMWAFKSRLSLLLEAHIRVHRRVCIPDCQRIDSGQLHYVLKCWGTPYLCSAIDVLAVSL